MKIPMIVLAAAMPGVLAARRARMPGKDAGTPVRLEDPES